MPLTKLQVEVLQLLAAHRNPESYVAGSVPINRYTPRFSGDIDIFFDNEQIAALRDEIFGYVLHPVDLATNKVAAASGRREPRDVVDLLILHDNILPLGAVVWASVGKSIGFTPEGVIDEIRRIARYTDADFRRVTSVPPVDPTVTMLRLREVLSEAEEFVAQMPSDKAGLLFLDGTEVVQPDPERLDRYLTHAGQRRGAWPSSPEITAAMFELAVQDKNYYEKLARQQKN